MVLSQENIEALRVMHLLAFIWTRQDASSEAIQLAPSYARLRVNVLGAEHFETKASTEILKKWEGEEHDPSDFLVRKNTEQQMYMRNAQHSSVKIGLPPRLSAGN